MSVYLPNTPDVCITPHNTTYPSAILQQLERRDLTQLGYPDPSAAAFLMTEDLDLYKDPDNAWHHFCDHPGFAWGIHRRTGEQTQELVGVAALWMNENVPVGTVGVALFRDEQLGSGLGSAAFMGAIVCAYERLVSRTVYAETAMANRRCIKTLRSLGLLPVIWPEASMTTYGLRQEVSPRTHWVGFNPGIAPSDLDMYAVSPEGVRRGQAKHAAAAARYKIEIP